MPIACLTSLIIGPEIDKAFSDPSISVFSTYDLSLIILLYSLLNGLKNEFSSSNNIFFASPQAIPSS